MWMVIPVAAQRVTVHADRRPAGPVFEETMRLAGKNFVYPAGLLNGITVTVHADDSPLDEVLKLMFAGTDISYRIKGKNVILQKSESPRAVTLSGYVREASTGEGLVGATVADLSTYGASITNGSGFYTLHVAPGEVRLRVSYPGFATDTVSVTVNRNTVLDIRLSDRANTQSKELAEVVVTSDRNHTIGMLTPDVGHLTLTHDDIRATPVMFGEADVVKTLQLQPGVSAGIEGLAGMYVHGGANDENLYMLDNIPLYQINHFGGLFSAFNTEAIKNVDFYKSTYPVKYGGRLSSVLDVHTKDGNMREHHGSFRLGLTSGALNIDGPIVRDRTTYSLAVRRSWFELLSVPAIALYNSLRDDDQNATVARYAFTDLNAKITHRFTDRSYISAMLYNGEDYLKAGEKSTSRDDDTGEVLSRNDDVSRLRWGNLVGALALNAALSPELFGEFTLAYTRYRSSLLRTEDRLYFQSQEVDWNNMRKLYNRNDIADVTVRADMDWHPARGHNVTFGANYTLHRFLPQRNGTWIDESGGTTTVRVNGDRVTAGEIVAYAGYDVMLNEKVRFDAGVHARGFFAGSRHHFSIDPRLSARWQLSPVITLKGAYSRMNQYIHQLTESAISLPTDQWVPVTGDLRPQSCDKLSAGAYFTFGHGYMASLELYRKWMHNLIDYTDSYFLLPGNAPWPDKLCHGSGRAKGIDVAVARRFGAITGQISYTMLWSDRQFDEKNGGRRFPSRFDNRHKINVQAGWRINSRWEVNAAWTGQSGNRYTFSSQCYDKLKIPDAPYYSWDYNGIDFYDGINNRRLPFYHRLDVSVNRYTRCGIWNFSLYNAYCNMNVISVRKMFELESSGVKTVYTRYRLIPVIPSVSYTWIF